MRQWYDRTPETVAIRVRPGRAVSVGAHEVFVLRRNSRVVDIVSEGTVRIRSILGLLASWFGIGPKVDGYIAHTDPIRLSYWTEDPTAAVGLGPEAFGPPLITRDSQPVVAQVTMEVSVDPENADRFLRVLGNRSRLMSGDLQNRFRDELRAKLGVELEKSSSEELRGNPALLRALYDQTRQEMASSLVNFGLRLDNFFIAWGLTLVQIEAIRRELREYQSDEPARQGQASLPIGSVWAEQGVNLPQNKTPRFARLTSVPVLLLIAVVVVAAAIAGVSLAGGNGGGDEGESDGQAASTSPPFVRDSDSIEVTLLSSSTKRDWLDQVVTQFNAENQRTAADKTIVVEVEHTRSGSSMNDIIQGKSKPVVWSPGDQSWVTLINETWRQRENHQLTSQSCPPTVYAPIGFAMWRPMAEALGWPDTPIGWNTIVELAADPEGWSTYGHPEWGQFRFGHSHPAHSNTGMLSMTSFVHGIVGDSGPLVADQVYQPAVEEAMRSLEQNTAKYGRGSTPLFDLMVEQGPGYVHAIAASEETTLRYNINNRDELRFPLAFIFPSGGTIWADHPYCILDNADWVSAEQSEAAAIFRDYLLAPEQQALAVENRLRPIDSSIPLIAPLTLDNGTDTRVTLSNATRLSSPDAVVTAAVIDLFMITKRKATVIIVLDVSGSMQGENIKTATAATAEFLTGLDPDDEVAVLTFSNEVVTLSEPGAVRDIVEGLSQRVRTLTAGGSTALHSAVCTAAAMAGKLQDEDEALGESRLYGIVLLSDSADTTGQPTEHQMFTTCLPATAEADGFKIFPIGFGGEANEPLLSRLALAPGGRLFTADPDSISNVYFSISAEQ